MLLYFLVQFLYPINLLDLPTNKCLPACLATKILKRHLPGGFHRLPPLDITPHLEYIYQEAGSIMAKMIKGLGWAIIIGCLIILSGCKGNEATQASERAADMTIQITSTAFKEGETIPRLYTCDDKDVSPPLAWTGVPTGTASLALVMDDPDAPSGTWVHWVLYNLLPDVTSLERGKSAGGVEGKNDFGRQGYGGPCPPRGSNHRYYIKLYALDKILDLSVGATKAQLESAMRGHILSQGQLVGKYGR